MSISYHDDGSVKHRLRAFEFAVGEEKVTFNEKLRSLSHDVVKVNAYTHPVGVAAEYAWIRHHYPGSERIRQSLSTLDRPAQTDQSGEKIRFDVIEIELTDGRIKEIYFDITSFFSGEGTSITDKDAFFARKLASLYQEN